MAKKRASEPIVPEREERNERGRFLPGHKPFGYNIFSRAGLIKRAHIIQHTPVEQVMQVMDSLREQAANGNAHAAGIWMAYAVGMPEKFVPREDDAHTIDALSDTRPIEELTNVQKLQRLARLEVELREAEQQGEKTA